MSTEPALVPPGASSAAEAPPDARARPASSRRGGVRLDSLTGLRFLAALLVFFSHISLSGLFSDPRAATDAFQVAARAGWIGVGFFFVLSGFVLTYSARSDDTARYFWRRRFAKIYPNHAVTWAVTLLLMAWVGQRVTTAQAGANLLLLHAWIPDFTYFDSVNPVSWSLCCEALFYALFPWLLRAVRRIPANRLWHAATAAVALIFAVPLIAELLPSTPVLPFAPVSDWQFWFVYLCPPVRVLDFVLGIVLARIVLEGRWIRFGLLPASALAIVGYVVMLKVPPLFAMTATTTIPLALLIAAAAAADRDGRRSVLRSRTMVWLGEISFAFYMTHFLVIYYGHYLLGATRSWSDGGAIGVTVLFLAGAVVAAALLHRFVEVPLMRLIGRPPRVAPAADAGATTG
ncbi:acyltransferase family protein [Actinospica robiniae]|uniref:acyltransferase family protein n=1 Tax=Actinospica robiniae TaxID=304901 RepID=UPI000419575E|nr:acyltransferase [Actinospica robiniae]